MSNHKKLNKKINNDKKVLIQSTARLMDTMLIKYDSTATTLKLTEVKRITAHQPPFTNQHVLLHGVQKTKTKPQRKSLFSRKHITACQKNLDQTQYQYYILHTGALHTNMKAS